MNTAQIKQLIKQELPLIIREDREMRQFIIDLSRHQYADKEETENRFERMMKKLEENQEQSNRRWEANQAELRRLREESERKWQEYRAETNQRFDKIDARFDKIDERLDKMDERFDKIDERLKKGDERFDKIDERLKKGDKRFDKLEHDVGVLKRDSFEQRCRNNAPSIFGRYLVRGREITNKIYDKLHEAHANGEISESQYIQINAVDLLWGGKLRTAQTEMVLVIEISWKVAMHDVNRAIERAEILQQVGFNTLPVVIGRDWDEAAMQADVVQVANGSVKNNSWLRTMTKFENKLK